jgi:O-methyltransferase
VQLYLDLMKKTLTFYLWGEPLREYSPPKGNNPRSILLRALVRKLGASGKKIYYKPPYDPKTRMEGRDHPLFAHTMIGLRRLDNIEDCVLGVLRDDVPGDLIETGVWRGGAVIFMKAVLRAFGDESRKVWVADSFEGLMKPNAERYPADEGSLFHTIPYLAVGEDEVRKNFEAYGLLDDNVRFLKGWFKDTLSVAPIGNVALLRLDGDMYESTMDVLGALYPKVSLGGYVIVDDFGDLAPCRNAVEDYRSQNGITEKIQWADWSCIYWRKEGPSTGVA